jgi:hypothetical protein
MACGEPVGFRSNQGQRRGGSINEHDSYKTSYKGTEFDGISHETDTERGWPRLGLTPPFEQDSLLCHFLDSLLVRAHLLRNLVRPGSYEDKILVQVRQELASFNAGV